MAIDGHPLTYHMNRKAGTIVNGVPTLAATGAANVWASTTGLALVGALNAKAGNGTSGTLSAPTLTLGATTGGGGTFAAGTYFWKVTASNANGETIGSNEVTKTLILNDAQALSWTAVPGATSYKVYRGTATNAENRLMTTTSALTYTDTGTAGSVLSPPGSNTATKLQPKELAGVLNQLAGTTGLEVDGAAASIP